MRARGRGSLRRRVAQGRARRVEADERRDRAAAVHERARAVSGALRGSVVMLTLGAAIVATAPFAVVLALLAWANRRGCRHREGLARQIALTDSVHGRVGAGAAQVVRRRGRLSQGFIAVPVERPVVVEALLAIVREMLAPRAGDRRSLEIVLTRQPTRPAAPAAARRGIRKESLSWT